MRQASVDRCPPCVIGDWLHAPDAPTILLYAHHDVQPAGYAERWSGDPFEPRERDGRLYGRGTADDKAGAVTHAAAVRAWLRTAGTLPCNVKVMIEGEEEIGSPRLAPFLAEYGDELRADVLLLADAGNWSVGTPGLTYSLRGLAGGTVRLRALESPLHSGMAGGAVPDPVMALARLLTTLVDERGDPAFDGCWDDWQPPTPEERARLDALAGERARPPRRVGDAPRRGARGRPTRSPCSSGCGCGPRSPSSGSTATRSRGRRTRSCRKPRRASACGWRPARTRTD